MKVENDFHELHSEEDFAFEISSNKLFGADKQQTLESGGT